MRWLFCCLSFSVLCSWLLCALCGKLPGRFLRPFHNHFQGRSLSSAAMFLASSHCAHSLFPSATGVQKDFTLWYRSSKGSGQQEEYTGKKHDEKGAKALSAWSRIRANKLKTFYDELNLSAGYSTATIHRSNLVFSLVSSLVFFCHSEIYCKWPDLLLQEQCWLHSGVSLGPLRMRQQQQISFIK